MENPYKNVWFGGTTIFGNIHMFSCFWCFILQIFIMMKIDDQDDDGEKNAGNQCTARQFQQLVLFTYTWNT